jgi:hypothetical protein
LLPGRSSSWKNICKGFTITEGEEAQQENHVHDWSLSLSLVISILARIFYCFLGGSIVFLHDLGLEMSRISLQED